MHRSIHQIDAVKLVIIDLDDTLWRGLAVEHGDIGPHVIEGWPLGFIEALLQLKKRGIVLAIARKNDEREIERIWKTILARISQTATQFDLWKRLAYCTH